MSVCPARRVGACVVGAIMNDRLFSCASSFSGLVGRATRTSNGSRRTTGWAMICLVVLACGFVDPLANAQATAPNEWTWMGGSNASSNGVYGTLGTPAAGNLPPERYEASSWTDTSGNFWVFGGVLVSYSGVTPWCNFCGNVGDDLWNFNSSTGECTWISGSSNGNPPRVYGTLGTP